MCMLRNAEKSRLLSLLVACIVFRFDRALSRPFCRATWKADIILEGCFVVRTGMYPAEVAVLILWRAVESDKGRFLKQASSSGRILNPDQA